MMSVRAEILERPNEARPVTRGGDLMGSWRGQVLAVGGSWAAAQRDPLPLMVALDRSGEWALDGPRTCAQWVASALDIEVCTAREWLRIGKLLSDLPAINVAFTAGRLSYSKVRTLSRVATPTNESDLCEIAERTPAGR
jgi:hypothetical protein